MQSIEYDEQIRALLGARISQTRRMGWEGRADEDLLFTSSPVQMHHEPDVTRVGHHHHRENTVQMQEFSTASRSPLFDANGDEIQTGDVQELADSLLGLYSDALPPTHRQETSEIPIRSRAHDSNAISSPTHQGDSGDRTHSPGGASHEPNERTFGTNVPRYIDPLPSALVDKFFAFGSHSQLTRPRPPPLRISTTSVAVSQVRVGR